MSIFLFITFFLLITYIKTGKNLTGVENFNTTIQGFEEFVMQSIGDGEMANAFLTYDQYVEKINTLREIYPDWIELESIGVTNDNNHIYAVKFKSKYHSNKAILFTGMHHAREPTSLMMNMYIIHKLVFLNKINNKAIRDLLDSVNIYFIPIVNIDGYKVNVENYFKYKGDLNKCMVRKNRQRAPDEIFKKCEDNENYDRITVGVDLNRNYGFMFNHNDVGSSGKPCQEDYRGPHAFSEPETLAIKNFIENHPEIKIAMNYHAWGNLLIRPFNYADSAESTMKLFTNYTFYNQIYDEFVEEANFPQNFLSGNGMETIKYQANGEAADWMLGEKRILAFSPELGVNAKNSEKFYVYKSTLFEILRKNLNSALYSISRAAFYFKIYKLKNTFSDCVLVKSMSYKFLEKNEEELTEEKLCKDEFYKFSSQVELKNMGFSDFKSEVEFEILIDNQILEYLSIKVNSGYNSIVSSDNKNHTEQSIRNSNQNVKSFGNPNTQIIYEKFYNKSSTYDENNFKITFLSQNDTDNISHLINNSSEIDVTNFKVLFVESYNHISLDFKFYVRKSRFTDYIKFLIENKLDFPTFYHIRRKENNKNIYDSTSNNNDTENDPQGDYLLQNYGLKYYTPDFKIKLKDFQLFNMKNGTLPSTSYESELRNIYKYVIIAVLLGLIILIVIFLFKLRGDGYTPDMTGQEEVIEEVIEEVVSSPSNIMKKERYGNNYIELNYVP
jgi:hypothetical protein